MEQNEPTLSEIVMQRSSTFSLLARLYRVEVDQALLDQMRTMAVPEIDAPEFVASCRQLYAYLHPIKETTLLDLAVDYARVFLGAGLDKKGGAYPYESVYTSPERIVMQDARDQVLKMYRDEGLDRSKEFKEPEDHIALELEFMAFLCQKTAAALNAGQADVAVEYLNKQGAFLEQHLLNWVPTFTEDIQRLVHTDFYKAVAGITLGYLKMEREVIADLIAEIATPSVA